MGETTKSPAVPFVVSYPAVVPRAYRLNTRCIAAGCEYTRCSENGLLHFFSMPVDDQRRRQWLTNCGREDLLKLPTKSQKAKLICQLHFHDTQFMNVQDRQKLVWNAVPTLFKENARKPKDVIKCAAPNESDKPKELPRVESPREAVVVSPDHRKYMIMCSDLKRTLNERERRLEALEKFESAAVDAILRQARALPPERILSLIGSLVVALGRTKCTLQSEDSDLGKLVTRKLLQLQQQLKDACDRPLVQTEVLLRNSVHPGSILLGIRSEASVGKGLYQVPGDYVRFGESWEDAATRAVLQDTGYVVEEPEVCAVVETVRVDEGYHCVSIFMIATVINCDVEPRSREESVRTGWQWCKWDMLPSEDLLFWSLQDLRRRNLISFDEDNSILP